MVDGIEEILGTKVDGTLGAVSLLVVVFVLFIFGLVLVMGSYDKAGRPDLPRWHPRRWVAPCLDFFYGLLIITFEVATWGYLGLVSLHDSVPLPLWFSVDAIIAGFLAMFAMKHFAQDRRKSE